MRRSVRLVAAATLLLAGCDLNPGPIVGDWRGLDSTFSTVYYAHVEIILDGPPGSVSGRYHYVRLSQLGYEEPDGRFTEWTGTWEQRPFAVDGRPTSLIHLDKLEGPFLRDYLLLPDGRLQPIADLRRPDLSRAAQFYALSPVPRGTFGYGRP